VSEERRRDNCGTGYDASHVAAVPRAGVDRPDGLRNPMMTTARSGG
jgi:hypothetical protein